MPVGLGAVEKAIAENKNRSDGTDVHQFFWKPDESRVLRFLTDDVISVKFHEFTWCKDGKQRDFVCTESFDDDLEKLGLKARECIICKNYHVRVAKGSDEVKQAPWSKRTVGLAVEREEYKEGGVLKIRDVLYDEPRKVKVGTNDKNEPIIEELSDVPIVGIVRQGHQNFWNGLIPAWTRYGTLMDRDYAITRKGDKSDTTYPVLNLDPIEGLKTPEEVKATYEPVLGSHPSLVEYLDRLSNETYMKKHVYDVPVRQAEYGETLPGGIVKLGGGSDEGPASSSPSSPAETKTESSSSTQQTSFGSLRDRMKAQMNS